MKRYIISLSLIAAGLIFLSGMWLQESRYFKACEAVGGLRDPLNNLICVGRDGIVDDEDDMIFDDPDVVGDSPVSTTKTVRGVVVSFYDDRAFDGNVGLIMQVGGGQVRVDTSPSGFGGSPPVGVVEDVGVGDEIEVYGNYYKGPPFPDTLDTMDVFGEEFYLKRS